MGRKAEKMGTCQACFSVQKLPKGRIALHGYERPGDGFIYGDCWGSHELPFEQSCEITKIALNNYLASKERLLKYQTSDDFKETFEFHKELEHINEMISFLRSKVDQWKPTDLIPLPDDKKKYLVQFRFTENTYIDPYKSVRTIKSRVNVWHDKKIVPEEKIEQAIQTLYKEYKYQYRSGVFEARAVILPEGHILKKYKESDYQGP